MANLDLDECFRVANQVAREAGVVSMRIDKSVKTNSHVNKTKTVRMTAIFDLMTLRLPMVSLLGLHDVCDYCMWSIITLATDICQCIFHKAHIYILVMMYLLPNPNSC